MFGGTRDNQSTWWPLGRMIPKKTNFVFTGFALPFGIVSGLACVLGALSMFVSVAAFMPNTVAPSVLKPLELNFGVDFKGGTLIEVRDQQPIDIAAVRSRLGDLGLGDVQVQNFGDPTDLLVRFETPEGQNTGAFVGRAQEAIKETIGPDATFPRVEFVGPKVSSELLQGGLIALGLAILMQLAYVGFRFEWQFGLGAVAALMHDVLLTILFFTVTKMEFTLTSIAALLSIIGFSMNDTVVVFDRFRENLRKYKKLPLKDIIDLSLNETLSRTIITGLTTLVALVGLLALGGSALSPFAYALIFGVFVGTYSSIYVAAPIILLWGVGRIRGDEDTPAAKAAAARP
jgi:preprotein translocase SecF subunit